MENYDKADEIMDTLEKKGVTLVYNQNSDEVTYEKFTESIKGAEENIENIDDLCYTDDDMTELEKELAGDYYNIKEYSELNSDKEREEFYNQVLLAKVQEAFRENGIEKVEINNIKITTWNVIINVTTNEETKDIKVGKGTQLYFEIEKLEQKDYEKFTKQMNRMLDELINLDITDSVLLGEPCRPIQCGLSTILGVCVVTLAKLIKEKMEKRRKYH